jgi:hypothetical protein
MSYQGQGNNKFHPRICLQHSIREPSRWVLCNEDALYRLSCSSHRICTTCPHDTIPKWNPLTGNSPAGRDVTWPWNTRRHCRTRDALPFKPTRVTVWLKAISFSVPKERNSFFETHLWSHTRLSCCDSISDTDTDRRPKETSGYIKCSGIWYHSNIKQHWIMLTAYICGFHIILKINNDCFPWVRNSRWRQYVPPKRRSVSTNLYEVTNHKTNPDIFTAVTTSDLVCTSFCFSLVK